MSTTQKKKKKKNQINKQINKPLTFVLVRVDAGSLCFIEMFIDDASLEDLSDFRLPVVHITLHVL
jgi:hypothetical protein